MSEPHSTTPAPSGKPAKPYPDFPLLAHATGRWAKKIRGKMHYFGPWGDPDGALAKYLEQKDALHAGRTPRPDAEGLTVKGLANSYLVTKLARVEAGELARRSWADYKEVCDLLVKEFGRGRLVEDLGPEDFAALRNKMAKRWGPVRLGNVIPRVRGVFKFAADDGLIARPVRYGQGFARPSAKTLRLHRAGQGKKLFTAEEVRRLIDGAGQPLKAMILLGINGGLGMADCGRLPLTAIDLNGGWVDFPRVKTGIGRRFPLWPETAAAIREALAGRPEPKQPEHVGLVFLTAQGRPWHKEDASSPMCFKVGQLLKRLGINGREGLGFYTLRHTFRTVADEAKDQPAADFIMGHEVAHVSTVYRARISAERLKAVTDHVRTWLFGAPAARATAP